MPVMAIFSQGEEVVTGQIVDSNAAWLAQEAVALGFEIGRHVSVGDKLAYLVGVINEISQQADCCLCTGGLGPTTDDLTAEAVALAFGLPLEFDPIAFEQIQGYFRQRNRPMADCNRKQAMLPRGARRLDNSNGTAPGFAVQGARCLFVFMPGVPREMKAMFLDAVRPLLQARFDLAPAKLVTLRTLGIGESDLQERLKALALPSEVQLGYRAEPGEVQVKLLFPPDFSGQEQGLLTDAVKDCIGDPVYWVEESGGANSKNLVEVLDKFMLEKAYSLHLVESLSHGLVCAKLSGVSWLASSTVVFDPGTLTCADHEAVSSDAEQGRAVVILKQHIDIPVCQALSAQQPVTVQTTVSSREGRSTRTTTLAGDCTRRQHQAATQMLDVLRRYLQGLDI